MVCIQYYYVMSWYGKYRIFGIARLVTAVLSLKCLSYELVVMAWAGSGSAPIDQLLVP